MCARLACPPSSHSACIPQLLTSRSSSPFMFLAFFTSAEESQCSVLCSLFGFFFSFFTNRAVSPAITTCATDLRATRADRLDYGLALAPCCYRSPDRVSWPGSILVSSNLVSALGTRLAPSVLAPWWLIQIQSIC